MFEHMSGWGMNGMGGGMLTAIVVLVGLGVVIGYLMGKGK